MANVTHESTTVLPRQAPARPLLRGRWLLWLPVVPLFLYVTAFLLAPTLWLMIGAFRTESGSATLANVRTLFQDQYFNAYLNSIKVSVTTALTGTICGFFVAYAIVKEGSPRWLRPLFTTFSGVAANFAGIPLAFAFAATLGTTGLVTSFLNSRGIALYQNGFTLYSFTGLVLVYTYFQLPLMILVISPAMDGLKRQWYEAATNLGATSFGYWRWVGLPILWPSLLSAFVLLFGNAFAAYATATALVGSQISLVPILIGRVTSGDFASDPQMANALSLGMVVIISIAMTAYALLQRRSSRWLR